MKKLKEKKTQNYAKMLNDNENNSSTEEKLCIHLDSKLNFEVHASYLRKEAGKMYHKVSIYFLSSNIDVYINNALNNA